jgi:glycosyltransferase involved in cell wall biosynthesis
MRTCGASADLAAPLLVFADDWGRHPSSCQHLVGHLLNRHPICWVNTIGTRKPGWNLATLQRGMEKFGHWFRRRGEHSPRPACLRVISPMMWPSFSSELGRRLNRWLLTRQLTKSLSDSSEPAVAITTLPITADLIGRIPVRRWVYYCVDDFSEWPGLDGSTLRRLEQSLVAKVDHVIAVSPTLQERLAGMGRTADLLTHGVDLQWWSNPQPSEKIAALDSLERPLVVFWGVIDRRMDVSFVSHLARSMTRGTIVLAGPENDPDPALFALDRVIRLGTLPFASLPTLARETAVLVMPYVDLPVTRAMQPLKLKEYLATGKPVVVRDLPSTRCWVDCLDVADSANSFVTAVRFRLEQGLPQEQALARRHLAGETWAEKARHLEEMIFGLHPAPPTFGATTCNA